MATKKTDINFEKALEENVKMHPVYGYYALALLSAEKLDKAETFLDFALTVKGADKGLLLLRKAMVHETRQDFKKAKKTIKKARLETYNDSFMSVLDDFDARIDKKIKWTQPKQKKKNKK